MTNEITKPELNAFEVYGNEITARTLIGTLARFAKGDYLAGAAAIEIPAGTKCVAIMPWLLVGRVCWRDGRPVDHRMGLVVEGFRAPLRKELGDTDESLWELDTDGKPKDPWQYTNYLPLIRVEDNEVFTFATASKGGTSAIGELCKAYGKAMRQKPDQLPVIALGVGSYQHKDKSLGRIKFPTFLPIIEWKPKGPFLELLELAGNTGGGSGDGGESRTVAELPAPVEKVEKVEKPDKNKKAAVTANADTAPRF